MLTVGSALACICTALLRLKRSVMANPGVSVSKVGLFLDLHKHADYVVRFLSDSVL